MADEVKKLQEEVKVLRDFMDRVYSAELLQTGVDTDLRADINRLKQQVSDLQYQMWVIQNAGRGLMNH